MSEPVGWPQNAYVGQKVVKILDHGDRRPGYPSPPLGEVLTVNFVGTDWQDDVMIDLVEYPSPEDDVYHRGYYARGFRPAQSTETGFKLLTALLVTDKQKEPA